MIGNDVVDLRLAATQSNWKRQGFLTKVFSEGERNLIETAEDGNEMVWLLWSMKEAGYKAHQRRFQLPRRLNWKEQECQIVKLDSGKALGVIKIGEECYFSSSRINPEMIFTSAIVDQSISHKNMFLEGSSHSLKPFFLEEIAEFFRLPIKHLEIQKNRFGIPMVLYKQRPQENSFSFTGHGRFAAFSLALMNC